MFPLALRKLALPLWAAFLLSLPVPAAQAAPILLEGGTYDFYLRDHYGPTTLRGLPTDGRITHVDRPVGDLGYVPMHISSEVYELGEGRHSLFISLFSGGADLFPHWDDAVDLGIGVEDRLDLARPLRLDGLYVSWWRGNQRTFAGEYTHVYGGLMSLQPWNGRFFADEQPFGALSWGHTGGRGMTAVTFEFRLSEVAPMALSTPATLPLAALSLALVGFARRPRGA